MFYKKEKFNKSKNRILLQLVLLFALQMNTVGASEIFDGAMAMLNRNWFYYQNDNGRSYDFAIGTDPSSAFGGAGNLNILAYQVGSSTWKKVLLVQKDTGSIWLGSKVPFKYNDSDSSILGISSDGMEIALARHPIVDANTGLYVKIDDDKSDRNIGIDISVSNGRMNNYGILVNVPEKNDSWAIKSVGRAKSYFSGKIGIGERKTDDYPYFVQNANPRAALDVEGTIRLAKNKSQPFICNSSHDEEIAMTRNYILCVCNGTKWVRTIDGFTECEW